MCGGYAALTSPAISILLNCTINTGRPANVLHTRKASSTVSNRPRSLFDAHSPRQPSVSPASPAFFTPESYFTMHATYLVMRQCFTLTVAAVSEKNGGRTEGHTLTHTDRPIAITLAAHARRRGLMNKTPYLSPIHLGTMPIYGVPSVSKVKKIPHIQMKRFISIWSAAYIYDTLPFT